MPGADHHLPTTHRIVRRNRGPILPAVILDADDDHPYLGVLTADFRLLASHCKVRQNREATLLNPLACPCYRSFWHRHVGCRIPCWGYQSCSTMAERSKRREHICVCPSSSPSTLLVGTPSSAGHAELWTSAVRCPNQQSTRNKFKVTHARTSTFLKTQGRWYTVVLKTKYREEQEQTRHTKRLHMDIYAKGSNTSGAQPSEQQRVLVSLSSMLIYSNERWDLYKAPKNAIRAFGWDCNRGV